MTKHEIVSDLKARGLFDKTGGRDQTWVKAFEMYHKETRRKLSMSCGSCWSTLRKWLQS